MNTGSEATTRRCRRQAKSHGLSLTRGPVDGWSLWTQCGNITFSNLSQSSRQVDGLRVSFCTWLNISLSRSLGRSEGDAGASYLLLVRVREMLFRLCNCLPQLPPTFNQDRHLCCVAADSECRRSSKQAPRLPVLQRHLGFARHCPHSHTLGSTNISLQGLVPFRSDADNPAGALKQRECPSCPSFCCLSCCSPVRVSCSL